MFFYVKGESITIDLSSFLKVANQMSISIAEAARLLRTSQQDIYQQLRNGQLTSKNLSGRRVITEGGLKEYIARTKRKKVSSRKSRF